MSNEARCPRVAAEVTSTAVTARNVSRSSRDCSAVLLLPHPCWVCSTTGRSRSESAAARPMRAGVPACAWITTAGSGAVLR